MSILEFIAGVAGIIILFGFFIWDAIKEERDRKEGIYRFNPLAARWRRKKKRK